MWIDRYVFSPYGFEPNDGSGIEEDFWKALCQGLLVFIPSGPF